MKSRSPLVVWSFAIYTALMLLGLLFEPILLLWPHLFLLAIQGVVPSAGSGRTVMAAILLGVIPVLFVAMLVQRRFHRSAGTSTFDYAWSGAWTTVLTLAGLTLAAFGLALVFGWPVGV